jgi:hypothetical protein
MDGNQELALGAIGNPARGSSPLILSKRQDASQFGQLASTMPGAGNGKLKIVGS